MACIAPLRLKSNFHPRQCSSPEPPRCHRARNKIGFNFQLLIRSQSLENPGSFWMPLLHQNTNKDQEMIWIAVEIKRHGNPERILGESWRYASECEWWMILWPHVRIRQEWLHKVGVAVAPICWSTMATSGQLSVTFSSMLLSGSSLYFQLVSPLIIQWIQLQFAYESIGKSFWEMKPGSCVRGEWPWSRRF